jgi:excisionase family DNA binding protein
MENIELVPLKEVQKVLHVSRATLWNWIQQGRISTVKLSPRKIYIRKGELERFVRESEK